MQFDGWHEELMAQNCLISDGYTSYHDHGDPSNYEYKNRLYKSHKVTSKEHIRQRNLPQTLYVHCVINVFKKNYDEHEILEKEIHE